MPGLLRKLRYVLNSAVEPSSEVSGADRYTARLISEISLIMAVMVLLAMAVTYPMVEIITGDVADLLRLPTGWFALGVGGFMASPYALSRTRHYRYSCPLLIAAVLTVILAISAAYPRTQLVNSVLVYSILAILLTDIFFSLRYVVAMIIVLLAGEFLLGAIVGRPFRLMDAVLIAPVQVVVGATILVAKIHRAALQGLTEKRIKDSARLERHRIAEEIHDAALQDILLVGRYLGVVKKRLSDAYTDEKVTEYIAACEIAIDRANTRLRGLLKETDPGTSMKEPLGSLIRDWLQVAKLWSDTRISLRLDLDEAVEERIGSIGTKLTLYYIIQEATMNAIRHADAEEIEIMVKVEKNGVLLTVRDDGVGFEASGNIGRGIYNMKRRAEEIGGQLTIRKGETGGTVVSLWSGS